MPPNQINRGALVAIRAITQLTPITGELMGFVDSFTCAKAMNAEVYASIGNFHGIASLYHGETGTFSWGEAHTAHDFTERGLVPNSSAEQSFTGYNLSVVRKSDGAKIALLLGAVPTSADISIASMSRLSSNISGVCQLVRFGSEVNPPATS